MINRNVRIAVIGGGSWAIALVKMLSKHEKKVGWYMRNRRNIRHIRVRKNHPNYLRALRLNTRRLMMSHDINKIVSRAEILVFAIPSAFLHKELSNLKQPLENKIIWSAIKGIVPENGLIVTDYLKNQFGIPENQFGVISGPCHAEEVAMERMSYLTLASENDEQATLLKSMLDQPKITCNLSKDVVGIEYAAVLKNIYAIASGIAHGLGYGDNFQAVLVSNATREMKYFVKTMSVGKTKRNINASAYLGDLLVTAYSPFSRNRTFGSMIGKGNTIKSIKAEMDMISEGYYAAKSTYKLVKKPHKTPIVKTVYEILYEDKDPREGFLALRTLFD